MGFADFRPLGRPTSSNNRRAALLAAIAAALVLAIATPAAYADTNDPLSYYGGSIAHSMSGVVVDWGSSVNSIYTNETTGDPGLIKYLASASGSTGDVSGVLAQYMDTSGRNAAPIVSYGGQYQIAPRTNATTLSDLQIQHELVSQITAGNLPRPAANGFDTVYLLLFPASDIECLDQHTCSGTQFCAYHGNARLGDGTPVLYAVLPDNTSGNMSQGCGLAHTALANQTSYTSHEWAETITDPLVGEASTTAPPLAWYDNNCPTESAICGEIGDKCNAQQALNGGWTVQLEWSNLDAGCVGNEPAYATPTASFTSSVPSATVGQLVTFDGSHSSDPSQDHTSMTYNNTPYSIAPGIATYSWNWGDGLPASTGANASHSFGTPGTYQVSLTVTDNLGFTSTVTQAVEVSSVNPSTPTVSTGAATGIDSQNATVGGSIDTGGQPVSYRFAYGTSPDSLTQTTPSTHLGPGTSATPVSATLSGLTPSTPYWYQLDVTTGTQTYDYKGTVQSFVTPAPPPESATNTGSGNSSQASSPAQATTTATQTPAPAVIPPSPPATTALPAAATGAASGVTSSGATVAGTVNPDGAQTSYLVEYGTSGAYGHSSLPASADAGQSAVVVSATLSGLTPRTVYHYRMVATNSAGTAVGADRTFKTPAAPPRPPRFSFAAPGRMTVGQALGRKLRVRFHCSTACTTHFTVTMALSGVRRFQAIPVALAHGVGHLSRAGHGYATLVFTGTAHSTLSRRANSVKLLISGYAVRGASTPSAPRTVRLTLTR